MDFFICSECSAQCPFESLHVIPWWNVSCEDFLTTFRCNDCWLKSLEETAGKVEGWDDETRNKFCEFLEGHELPDVSRHLRKVSPSDAAVLALEFLERLRNGALELHA